MRFTWDPHKAASNERKHGVSFEEAAQTFGDPFGLFVRDNTGGEVRLCLIGTADSGRLLFTVHVEVGEDAIRVISARNSTKRERRRYEQGA